MSAGKHTPGPWHVGPQPNGRIVYDATGWAIADAKLFHGNRKDGEDVHNARLIAAAPDLLEALVAAEAALNKIRVCCHHTAWDATGPAVIAARAAIAKATGSAA